MSILHAIIIAIIEGITEFLPISSTGHMVIGSALLGIDTTQPFIKLFLVAIQFGAILSVVVLFFKHFFVSINFYIKLFIAFIPAVFFGVLLNDFIDKVLGNVIVVAISLLVGGIVLLFVDKYFAKNEEKIQQPVSYKNSFVIGCFQVLAMVFPGLSRSASTIVGGLTQGLNRKNAAEFSFLLAVPTMFAATCKQCLDFFKDGNVISNEEIKLLIIGNIVAFIVALLAIKFFIGVLNKYGFKVFGIYRIIVGLIILILIGLGIDLQIV